MAADENLAAADNSSLGEEKWGLIRFFYDYNSMTLQLEPRFVKYYKQTE